MRPREGLQRPQHLCPCSPILPSTASAPRRGPYEASALRCVGHDGLSFSDQWSLTLKMCHIPSTWGRWAGSWRRFSPAPVTLCLGWNVLAKGPRPYLLPCKDLSPVLPLTLSLPSAPRTIQNYLVWRLVLDRIGSLSQRFKDTRVNYRKVSPCPTRSLAWHSFIQATMLSISCGQVPRSTPGSQPWTRQGEAPTLVNHERSTRQNAALPKPQSVMWCGGREGRGQRGTRAGRDEGRGRCSGEVTFETLKA